MLTQKQMRKYKRVLAEERKQLLARIQPSNLTPNPADERDTDEADIIVNIQTREQKLWALDELQQRLYSIEHALKRIQDGTYGQCESCGADIAPERLDFLPETTLCVRCRERLEKSIQYAPPMQQIDFEEDFFDEEEEEFEEEEEGEEEEEETFILDDEDEDEI